MNEIAKKIVGKLIELHGSKEFKIAFLPYKRSMWNSMESVYDECRNAGIDAHVYPIPYYRLKADGTVQSIDTDYDYYEYAEPIETLEKPDYIVIHYYYDDLNRVTSMLPEYHTKAIKERYGCKIVFLPYGIKFDYSKPDLFYPSFYDVDYIFTNEITDEWMEAWKKVGVDWTGRIFNYGSTKLDIARRIAGRKEVPSEWGIGDKKVTLITTSLIPYIEEPYKRILDYLVNTLVEISKGRAVIFRPHPLLRTTIKTMSPESEPYYDFLMDELRAIRGVIVDESEYLERAMLAADYLISDPSSVVRMWQETDKPFRVM